LTCIVGLIDEDYVYIGGDRLATDGSGHKYKMCEEKVWSKGSKMIFGCAGDLRELQLLEYGTAIPPLKEGQLIEEYIVLDLVNSFKQSLHEGGALEDIDNVEKIGSMLLMGFDGRLFNFDPRFAFTEHNDGFMAVGSGRSYALGSLYSTQNSDTSSEDRIKLALECAEHYNAYVEGEYDIVKIPRKPEESVGLDMDKILKRANEKMKEG